MWSIGVICYILLSGLSPFLGDNDAETLSNVTSGEYDFDDESFDDISDKAKDFIGRLLVKRKERRLTIPDCEKHRWLSEEDQRIRCKRLNTDRLRCFMARRKWQKTGNAIRALGRMASLQKLLSGGSTSHSSSGSLSSIPDTPTNAPSTFGMSTPEFSSFAKQAGSVHPLSSTAVKEMEEKRGELPAASSATTTTTNTATTENSTTTRETDRGKRDSKEVAEINNGDSVKAATRTAAAPATTTAADRQAWRRGRQDDGGDMDTSPSQAPYGRSKLTKQDALAGSDAIDSAQKAPQPSATDATNIITNNKNETDRFSPSQAQHVAPADSNPGMQHAPQFLKEMVDCTAFKGDAVRFDITVTGSPPPRLTWMLEEEEVEEDERHIVELGENGQCSLIVRHVSEDDEGEYLCKAINSHGEASCTADLHVYSMGSV